MCPIRIARPPAQDAPGRRAAIAPWHLPAEAKSAPAISPSAPSWQRCGRRRKGPTSAPQAPALSSTGTGPFSRPPVAAFGGFDSKNRPGFSTRARPVSRDDRGRGGSPHPVQQGLELDRAELLQRSHRLFQAQPFLGEIVHV